MHDYGLHTPDRLAEAKGPLEEGSPGTGQEVPAGHLNGQIVAVQQLAEEGLLVEVVAPHEDERRPVS